LLHSQSRVTIPLCHQTNSGRFNGQIDSRLDSPQLNVDVERCQKLLGQAQLIGEELNIVAQPELRIEYDIAHGISHASREVEADLIVLGFDSLFKIILCAKF